MKTSLIQIKGPGLIQYGFPGVLWHGNRLESAVYITFDDGPHPYHTPHVLDILSQNHTPATFACQGAHVELHP